MELRSVVDIYSSYVVTMLENNNDLLDILLREYFEDCSEGVAIKSMIERNDNLIETSKNIIK